MGLLDILGTDVRLALLAECADFEDAVMIETAKRSGMGCIVTRNTKHYAGASIPVYEPAEFLRLLLLAQEQLANNNLESARSEADVMKDLGISETDIDAAEDVEIE